MEMLKLLDQSPRQEFISTAEAVLLASSAGQTALHLSVSLGFERLSRELIVRGVDADQRDVNGCTALHFAALYGNALSSTLAPGAAEDPDERKSGCPHEDVEGKNSMKEREAGKQKRWLSYLELTWVVRQKILTASHFVHNLTNLTWMTRMAAVGTHLAGMLGVEMYLDLLQPLPKKAVYRREIPTSVRIYLLLHHL